MNRSKRLHKQHYYDKNGINWTCVVDSVCHKGVRHEVLTFGKQLQTSAIVWNHYQWSNQLSSTAVSRRADITSYDWCLNFLCCTDITIITTRSKQQMDTHCTFSGTFASSFEVTFNMKPFWSWLKPASGGMIYRVDSWCWWYERINWKYRRETDRQTERQRHRDDSCCVVSWNGVRCEHTKELLLLVPLTSGLP